MPRNAPSKVRKQNTLPRVLITNRIPVELCAPLAGLASVIDGPADGNLMSRAEILRHGADVEAIINQAELRVDRELLDHCPRLRVVANVATGIDNIDLRLLDERGVWATNTPDVSCPAIADLTLAFVLCLARRVLSADSFVRSGKWREFQPGVWDGELLAGRTLGIVGYGRTGKEVETRARAFGMNVIHFRRTDSGEPGYRSFDALLQTSDFVTVHVPLTPETAGLMNRTRFARMKRGAFFLNLARGKVVVESDLVEALRSGHLSGAALDVFEEEPQVHPELLKMPNVILSPHIAGGTHQTRRAARALAVENVASVLRGERPANPVNNPKPRAPSAAD